MAANESEYRVHTCITKQGKEMMIWAESDVGVMRHFNTRFYVKTNKNQHCQSASFLLSVATSLVPLFIIIIIFPLWRLDPRRLRFLFLFLFFCQSSNFITFTPDKNNYGSETCVHPNDPSRCIQRHLA